MSGSDIPADASSWLPAGFVPQNSIASSTNTTSEAFQHNVVANNSASFRCSTASSPQRNSGYRWLVDASKLSDYPLEVGDWKCFAQAQQLRALQHSADTGITDSAYHVPSCGSRWADTPRFTDRTTPVPNANFKIPIDSSLGLLSQARAMSMVDSPNVQHGSFIMPDFDTTSDLGLLPDSTDWGSSSVAGPSRTLACPTCDRKFTKQSYLRSHELVHTKEQRYGCTVPDCFSRFGHLGNLKRHLAEVHNIETRKKRPTKAYTVRRRMLPSAHPNALPAKKDPS